MTRKQAALDPSCNSYNNCYSLDDQKALKLRNSTSVIEKCQHWINKLHSWYQPIPNNIEILTHSLWPVHLWLPLLSKSLELSVHCTSNCEHLTFLPREGEENEDTPGRKWVQVAGENSGLQASQVRKWASARQKDFLVGYFDEGEFHR